MADTGSNSSSSSTRTIRVVCVSDTHNDVPTPAQIPAGDVFIHAGDMTDAGTQAELQKAYDWIAALPHQVKIVVAGNHDLALDPFHSATTRDKHLQARALFTSPHAQARGMHYLDSEVRFITVQPLHHHQQHQGESSSCSERVTVGVYGNPHQPQWLTTNYAFTYKPFPAPESEAPWKHTPTRDDPVPIWVMHGGPQRRLDKIDIPPLEGCVVSARKLYAARPLLAVFGHFHVAYGVEHVSYRPADDAAGDDPQAAIKSARIVTKPAGEGAVYDYSGRGPAGPIRPGAETLFVNAAWMTGLKRQVPDRNPPVVVDLELPVSG